MERDDFTTETGCTVRLRFADMQDRKHALLIYDMGPRDARFAELRLTEPEVRALAARLDDVADLMREGSQQ